MKIPGTKTFGNERSSDIVKVTDMGRIAIPAFIRKQHGIENRNFYLLHYDAEAAILYVTFYEKETDAPQSPKKFLANRIEIYTSFRKMGLKVNSGTVKIEWSEEYKAIKINLGVLMLGN